MPALEIDIKSISSKGAPLSFTVQIVKQRYRGSRAGYTTSNGFIFASLSCPAIGMGYNSANNSITSTQPLLYLRGTSSRNDDNLILETDSIGYIEKLKEAVIEYNEHFE